MHDEPEVRTLDAETLAHLQTWIDNTETRRDVVTAVPVAALSATLDRDDAAPESGTEIPALWHWLYFLPQPGRSDIGPDGHARRGGFLPPVPLARRMWAGGRLTWQAGNPLLVGDAIRRDSVIDTITHKRGRTGDLLFVVVRHEIHNDQGLALTEEHDIVYRANPQPGDAATPPLPAGKHGAWVETITPDDVLLFRYSALTFNGHRIHYDRKYAVEVEGYPGLIVHGPLIATLLLNLLRSNMPAARVLNFEFRAVRPVFDLWPFKLHGRPSGDGKTVELWTEDHEGWLTMQATATLA